MDTQKALDRPARGRRVRGSYYFEPTRSREASVLASTPSLYFLAAAASSGVGGVVRVPSALQQRRARDDVGRGAAQVRPAPRGTSSSRPRTTSRAPASRHRRLGAFVTRVKVVEAAKLTSRGWKLFPRLPRSPSPHDLPPQRSTNRRSARVPRVRAPVAVVAPALLQDAQLLSARDVRHLRGPTTTARRSPRRHRRARGPRGDDGPTRHARVRGARRQTARLPCSRGCGRSALASIAPTTEV